MAETDKRAGRQWDKSEISYKNYVNYISFKSDKFKLTLMVVYPKKLFYGTKKST